ncbi:YciI family protein [Actinophytocola sp. NPDC049390]|uniref:YciI family protein n=1 Tax=Actinophytocola sp. NPDC049390 TaxID=3363894 RepID=UPI00379ED7EE
MARYMLSVHSREGAVREPVNEEAMLRSHAQLGEIERDMAATGAWVFSGRLHEPDTATVVRASGGEVLTTDGPFAESKDHLGGFYVIEAPDLDSALGWAAKVTACIGVPIEVRPFAGFADKPQAP